MNINFFIIRLQAHEFHDEQHYRLVQAHMPSTVSHIKYRVRSNSRMCVHVVNRRMKKNKMVIGKNVTTSKEMNE